MSNHNKFIAKQHYSGNMPKIAVFDIETEGIGLPFIIAMTNTFPGEHKVHLTLDSLFEELLSQPGTTWFAHNSAKFDFVYIASRLKDWCVEAGHIMESIDSGSTTIGAVLGQQDENGGVKRSKDNIILRDSMRLTGPMSLYNFTRAFAPEYIKLKGDIDFAGGEVFDPNNERHMTYLERDVDGLFAALLKLHETCYETFGCYPSWTGPSSAIRAWLTTIHEGDVFFRQEPKKETFARKAYYGGFVYIGRSTHRHNDVMGVDVHAAYANAMRKGVPVGEGVFTCTYIKGRPGIYEVIAHNPQQQNWPLMPYKDKNGLHWLTQETHTYITSIEIEWYKKRGWTFSIIKGVVYERLEPIFNVFLDQCAVLENPFDGSKPDPAKKGVAKIFRNGLYGKLGMRTEIQRLIYADDVPLNSGYMPVIDVDGDEIGGVYHKFETVDASYLNVHMAAFITAWQRLYLFDAIEAIGIEYVYYTDTDSIKAARWAVLAAIERGNLHIGKEYGDWEVDGQYDWLQVQAPKVYHGEYTDEWVKQEGLDNNWFGKAKGIPHNVLDVHHEILTNSENGVREQYHFDSLISFKSALQNDDDKIYRERKRRVTDLLNSTGWEVLDDGAVRPRVVEMRMPNAEPTSQEVIEMLVDNGFQIVEIARKIGVSRSTIHRFTSGENSGAKYLLPLKNMLNQINQGVQINV